MFFSKPIVPKNADGVARIISVGRLSQPKETEAETQQSLEAIQRENERMLGSFVSGPVVVKYLAEQVSGMLAERATMTQLWELVATGEWDAIVAEDLSRIFRNPRFQLAFLQDCADAGIRVICFADNLDTADENWESAALLAAARHGLMIPDTRRRIKRTATASFKRGGMVVRTKSFYARVSKEDAESGKYGPKGLRIRRLIDYAWVVEEIRRRLLAGESPESIVAWLNAEHIPCGAYVKSGRWTLRLLRGLLEDPIMHGTRTFRDMLHIQIFGTGKYRRDKNATPDTEYVPELAFMTREEQEAMLAIIGWEIDWGGVDDPKRPSPRKGVSRYDSHWPAQSASCGPCGSTMYATGKFLKCSGSFTRDIQTCWNHVLAPIALLRAAVVSWFVGQCNKSPEFLAVLLDAAKRIVQQQRSNRDFERETLEAKAKDLESQERNLRKSIRIAADIPEEDLKSLVEDLAAVTAHLREVRRQIESADRPAEPFANCTDDKIVAQLPELLHHLIGTSFEFAEIVRGFVPTCVIVPVQSLDTGQVYARAKLKLRGNVQDHDQLEELVVDLFEPALHVRVMQEAVALRSQTPRPTLKQIGAKLGVSYMTVKRALGYHRLMDELGMTEPFRELSEKPDKASRWRDAS